MSKSVYWFKMQGTAHESTLFRFVDKPRADYLPYIIDLWAEQDDPDDEGYKDLHYIHPEIRVHLIDKWRQE